MTRTSITTAHGNGLVFLVVKMTRPWWQVWRPRNISFELTPMLAHRLSGALKESAQNAQHRRGES